jgi:hypothetical protein
MMGRPVAVHVALLAVACAASLYVWTRDTKVASGALAEVSVWPGRPGDVRRIALEASDKTTSLDAHEDAQGRWYSGRTQGTGTASSAAPPTQFASVAAAEKIAEALAPFKALRSIGRIDAARASEFGLKDPSSTLIANVGGKEHRLSIGAPTPNGNDRYVRDESSGYVYAASGDFVRTLEGGASALLERELHEFQDADVASVRVIALGKAREVLHRGPATKRIWADPGSPDTADETVTNWLSKVDRLQPLEYVADPPAPPERVVRVEYKAKGGDGQFLELAKVPGENNVREYRIRSERTRMWCKTYAPWAEQVEQDLGSVLK